MEATNDRASEVKAFDEMKIGVKGLVDTGVTQIPRIFHHPHLNLTDSNLLLSSTTMVIPTIDLKGGVFNESTVTREIVVPMIRDAVEKFGFFQVINHGIPIDVMEKMKDGIRGFHEQDSDVRKKFYTRDITKKVKYNTNFDLYSSPSANWRDTLSCFMSPDVPKTEDLPDICGEIMLEYSKRVMKLGELIFELLSEALGLDPNHLKEMDCTKGLLMLSHYYPPCPEPDLTFGTSQHSDRSFLTILLQDHIGGLQVLQNGYWVDVPPVPGALLVNLGDLLQLMTNDKFLSVEHRVLANRGEEPRISVASFFVHPLPSLRVYGPIKKLLSVQNLPKYRDTTVSEYTNHYMARGLDGKSVLLDFKI
ncbi:Oxoglutarate/iron-dependent dioxygenase [Arabidopsis thaliana x Arabidopsis arenosa]|uniref:Oxoglutarate/iron-dependent dioxygenase n=1 Tax=Arabidopsis thaliana x Arabidopsis arenosa TaxID=1240361 RepID=A0A8T2AA70_9BRAS|nr:Oxoglutarate/iron-dependent dioxygenase [Arabidopsis thaliana x Arabidopsis arenosa]